MSTSILNQLRADVQPAKLLPTLSAGLVLGVIGVLTYITPMAALIFSGKLAPFLAAGISLTLFSAAVVAIVAALTSSFVGTLALPVPEEMTLLATIAATIATQMPADTPPESVLLTVVAAIATASVLTGLFLLTLGQLRLGELIRFLPYPVVGGFLGGLGCLLSQGALTVMTGLSLSVSQWSALGSPEIIWRWLPGLALALVLLFLSRRYTHFLIIPASFLTATALFYGIWFLTGHAWADAGTQGWLLGPFPDQSGWRPMSLSALSQAHWTVIWPQLGSMLTVMVITALSLLLVASGIELATEQELNLNQELRAIGLGCFLSGLFGGTVGSHGVTTVLVHKMGAQSRLVGIVTALVYLVVLWLGIAVISFFPKLVLGGLLLYLGLDLLMQWLYDAWFKLPRADYGIVLLITAIIATLGFVQGVAAGLVVAIAVFVLNYSHINVAKYVLSGRDYQSHVQRPITQERLLRQKGDQIYILQLQGLIFFGTAHRLLQQIRQRIADPRFAPPKFMILDFRLANGLDSSAVMSFVKLKQLAQQEDIQLVFTQLTPALTHQLRQGGALPPDPNNDDTAAAPCQILPDLEQGMEWCEEAILAASQFRRQRTLPMAMQLKMLLAEFATPDQIASLLAAWVEIRYAAKEMLFQVGDAPQSLYWIETGQVSVWRTEQGQRTQRLQTLRPGTILGDRAFFMRSPQETVAIADTDSKVYQLSLDHWQQLKQNQPQTAAMFSEFMNALLSERLARTQKEVALLLQ